MHEYSDCINCVNQIDTLLGVFYTFFVEYFSQ
jgi:hypothetical protein